jgi:SAM-dependent methyltransferase
VPAPVYELAPCPVCGSPRSDTIADSDAVRAEVEALWEFHGERLRPGTPPERLIDRVAFSQHPALQVVRCSECGLVYRNPRERAFVLAEVYGQDAPPAATLEALYATQFGAYREQAERLTSVAGRPGRVLEVGSYVGGFLAAAAGYGWNAEGIDVNAAVNEFARSKGLRVTDGDLSSWEGAGGFDAVAIWNVFDQLADPRAAAHRARELVSERGLLVVRVPNGAFYARVRTRLGGRDDASARALLAHNNLLAFPYRHGFTLPSLSRLLTSVGFAVERVFGDTLVPIADEWTRDWAAEEERAVKRALCEIAAADADRAPWLEVYARATGPRPERLARAATGSA